jgi:hypothetical protein
MSDVNKPKTKVQGLVAQIINSRELAINVGEDHGVREKMRFAVLAATPLEIKDPKTKEVLDTIDREKVRVEAIMVRPKITICRTYQTRHIPGGPLYNISFPIGSGIDDWTRPPRTIVETLKADEESYPEPLSESDSYVKIGDRVIEVDE